MLTDWSNIVQYFVDDVMQKLESLLVFKNIQRYFTMQLFLVMFRLDGLKVVKLLIAPEICIASPTHFIVVYN